MAIQFARTAYVSRSDGGNACLKAAYSLRGKVKCERTGEVFNFSKRGGNVHHEILLPEGVDPKFKNSSYLWNMAENIENERIAKSRKNSF